jgi:tetratricopeptide (TPR) repeat protein
MTEPDEYKRTFLDRHGPEGLQHIRAFGFGLMVFGLTFGVIIAKIGFHWWVLPVAVFAGVFGGAGGFLVGELAGGTYKHMMVNGSSTPYVEQYSYQQSLVMAGKLDEALESFEAVIAEKPDAIDACVKAAELYDRDKKNHVRAAELFRQVQRIETVQAGQFVYATNRLVDLYTGPLNEPGKALGELRKLIDRYPSSPAAAKAREALAVLKRRVIPTEGA